MAPVTGFGQYWYYNNGSSLAIGLVTGGGMPMDPNVQDREGIQAQHLMVGGSQTPGGNVQIAVQDKTFFTTANYLLRSAVTNPALTTLIFEGGSDAAGTDDGSDWRHTGCLVAGCKFSCGIDGALMADLSWMGTGMAAGTGTPASQSAQLTYEWFSGVVTLDGAALLAQSMDLTISNNVRPYFSLDTKAAGSQRFPDGLITGSEEVSLTCDVLTFPGSGRISSWITPDRIAVNIAASFAFVGTDTITFTLANLACTGIGIPFQPGDGTVVYPLSFRGKKNSLTTVAIA